MCPFFTCLLLLLKVKVYRILICFFSLHKKSFQFETYYGPGSEAIAVNRMKELTPHANFTRYEHWIEPDNMWLYQDPDPQDVKKFFVI